ncbi:hypothetical protein ABEF92_007444 [Exophiala dermatitidis]|uniref:Uncharacterized protein n=1 Tax=Exophiala dermatitidis (strain ATCC 34100 / CBS 525.76 / NIH/UT8656) TaxID=858893 RepID=H6C6U9_EXODN|nr:uncharacterized protein HMPREF1120_07435 [Exophiala dermatitidis NIH/UT8656]EHY59445.1 hypothetical protein HMPREF1120_07435 [Exophiala dermatitidis NIH/UT8656]
MPPPNETPTNPNRRHIQWDELPTIDGLFPSERRILDRPPPHIYDMMREVTMRVQRDDRMTPEVQHSVQRLVTAVEGHVEAHPSPVGRSLPISVTRRRGIREEEIGAGTVVFGARPLSRTVYREIRASLSLRPGATRHGLGLFSVVDTFVDTNTVTNTGASVVGGVGGGTVSVTAGSVASGTTPAYLRDTTASTSPSSSPSPSPLLHRHGQRFGRREFLLSLETKRSGRRTRHYVVLPDAQFTVAMTWHRGSRRVAVEIRDFWEREGHRHHVFLVAHKDVFLPCPGSSCERLVSAEEAIRRWVGEEVALGPVEL